MSAAINEMRLAELFCVARSKNASDLHIVPGGRPVLRIDGALQPTGEITSGHDCQEIAGFIIGAAARQRLDQKGDVTFARCDQESGPLRLHAYSTANGISFAVRFLALKIPSLESLQLPAAIEGLAKRQNGLVLFAGPTGSGKTTTLAALADCINRNEARHIITIEDPIEYEHTSRKSIVSQREIGRDVPSFSAALRGALRCDPDVIVLGEMRDAETMRAALTAAETGHLVFATLHTGDAAQTIDRIIDGFPGEEQAQVRAQLSQTLLAVVCLRLVPRASGTGRRAAAEILLANEAVRNLIREQKTYQLRNVIGTAKQIGMQTLESHLSEMVMRRDISIDAAKAATDRPQDVRTSDRSAT